MDPKDYWWSSFLLIVLVIIVSVRPQKSSEEKVETE